MTAALGSGSAPPPSLPQPRLRAPRLIVGSAPSRLEAPASPPVALTRLRICAPTRSQVLLAQRRYDEAMAAYREALKHFPDDALAREAVAWAAHLAPGERHSPKAERKAYDELLKRDPGFLRARLHRAQLLWRMSEDRAAAAELGNPNPDPNPNPNPNPKPSPKSNPNPNPNPDQAACSRSSRPPPPGWRRRGRASSPSSSAPSSCSTPTRLGLGLVLGLRTP